MYCLPRNGSSAPARTDRSGLTASSSEKWLWLPSPEQSGQAPIGLLKENSAGWMSGSETPQSGQTKRSVSMSSVPSAAMITKPSPSCRAVCTASAMRLLRSGCTDMRSTTTSTLCFLFLSNGISSSSQRTSPSTRTRMKPFLRSAAKTFLNSPFWRARPGREPRAGRRRAGGRCGRRSRPRNTCGRACRTGGNTACRRGRTAGAGSRRSR